MDDQTAILTAITVYREAFNTGDIDRLMSVFAPSFTDMSYGIPSFFGAEAAVVLRRRMSELFAKYRAEMKISVIDVVIKADVAYDYGWHILTLTPKSGGEPIKSRQRYFGLWARQSDGSWKIKLYIDNADRAPAMPDAQFALPYLSSAAL
jgi:ketosteroid isomerase-like protein